MASMTLDDVVRQLARVYGEGLRTVAVYGSTAAAEPDPRRPGHNLLVIVDAISLPRLRESAAVASAWSGAGNPPPLTLTADEWRSSADIFPMEYADILERHRILHGALPAAIVQVKVEDLRLEVEQQAMGKLLQFRRGVLEAGGEFKRLVVLLEDSLSTFMVIFRGVVRLDRSSPPADYEALSGEVARRAGFDAAPFVRVVRHVRGNEKLSRDTLDGVLEGYLTALPQLVSWLDRYR